MTWQQKPSTSLWTGDQSRRNSRWTVLHWMSKVRTDHRLHKCVLISHINPDKMILSRRSLGCDCELFQQKQKSLLFYCGGRSTAQAVMQLLLTACHVAPHVVSGWFLRTQSLSSLFLYFIEQIIQIRSTDLESELCDLVSEVCDKV